MKRNTFIEILLFTLTSLFLAFIYKYTFETSNSIFLRVTWIFSCTLTSLSFLSYIIVQYPAKKLKKSYKIAAIIPAYNEDNSVVYRTIESILNQSIEVQEIHVIDDGSKEIITPYVHEKVKWYRQKNQGKRYAQKKALDSIDQKDIDLVLTVDSDSELEYDALFKLLIALESNDKNNAVTGMILVRNYSDSIMTRIADLNIGVSCITVRPIRSLIGSLETTSGALSIYKKEVLYNNLEDYVLSGTFSDDRQLCLYSLLEGRSIATADAIVYTDMPKNWQGTYRQRLRWGKGSWKYFPFQIRNLSLKQLFFPVVSMIQIIFTPLFYFYLVYSSITQQDYTVLVTFIIFRIGIKYIHSALYLSERPAMSLKDKLFTLLIITPFEFIFSSGALY